MLDENLYVVSMLKCSVEDIMLSKSFQNANFSIFQRVFLFKWRDCLKKDMFLQENFKIYHEEDWIEMKVDRHLKTILIAIHNQKKSEILFVVSSKSLESQKFKRSKINHSRTDDFNDTFSKTRLENESHDDVTNSLVEDDMKNIYSTVFIKISFWIDERKSFKIIDSITSKTSTTHSGQLKKTIDSLSSKKTTFKISLKKNTAYSIDDSSDDNDKKTKQINSILNKTRRMLILFNWKKKFKCSHQQKKRSRNHRQKMQQILLMIQTISTTLTWKTKLVNSSFWTTKRIQENHWSKSISTWNKTF